QLEEAGQAHDKALDAMRGQRDVALAELAQLRQAHSALMQESTQVQQTLAQRLQELQTQALTLTAAQTENAGLQQRLADRAAEAHALNQQLTQA
ncbi:hypothetical protein, partial [Staphylococcus aureus]